MRGGSIAVVGGSIAGCATALAASRGGAGKITVFERADAQLRDRGVGIALHSDRYDELRHAGYVAPEMPWAPLTRRVWSMRDGETDHGRAIGEQPFPFRAYSWGSLWSELRRRVPEEVSYRSGAMVTGVEPDADGVTLRLADGYQEHFDVVIGADGYRSVVREAMFPGVSATYAGYIGWRGTSSDVAGLPSDGYDAHNIVFPGGHCMIYRIPDGVGGHRLNWVLYTTPPQTDGLHPDLRTPTSLPPGRLHAELTTYLRALVADSFPPYWALRVLRTPPETTFIQPIYDLEVPHYTSGRMVLVGDAASVARPHIGGGSVKALQDATALEAAWVTGSSWQEVLERYDANRCAVGAAMVALARRMGSAQVENTPDWSAMGQPEFDVWWQDQNKGSDRRSGFGGHSIKPDKA
ncbi:MULTISPECIES: FAD-dependent monooxygenase [unclassified Streptomyces]|uniref:FAD-dependent monooxygenase n=1 Tax=unclassified Streptomyces TaxID=2593676 RepID=UPI00081E239C|nr:MULTISPECIES: FAD-dependent monooxygenase [unclassified Streptomyces]MYZ38286.1 monooxygenase [Streptomyces sp. SID4917]SCF97536.1 2-polyprenyl-6-methoxyphenol hydroxylase [Streptomyces sp. MnatMP-M17]